VDDSPIPSAAEPSSFSLSKALVTLAPDVTAAAEAFRALRTHIMAQHLEKGRRALAICAPTAGVGCTIVAANLAVSLSQIGVKTLLVDANLRHPGLDTLFIPSSPVEGLEQCLSTRGGNFGDYIESEVLPDLSIMFAGSVPDNPQELLATGRFEELMNFCLRDFQMTILDTPPANTCSDARRVSTVAGYSLIVSRRNKTLVNDVKTLIGQLESERARVVGSVMTES
jgi:capsular exopolysaccharide synthesis family protein